MIKILKSWLKEELQSVTHSKHIGKYDLRLSRLSDEFYCFL